MSQELSLKTGDVIEIVEKSNFFLAIILDSVEKNNKLRCLLESGKEATPSIKQISLTLPLSINTQLPSSMLASELKSIAFKANELMKSCDISLLWELLSVEGQQKITLNEAKDLLFEKASPVQILALARAFRKDSLYFKNLSFDLFEARSDDKIREIQRQQEALQKKHINIERLVQEALQILALKKESRRERIVEILENTSSLANWKALENLALLNFENEKEKSEAEKLLEAIQAKSQVGRAGTQHLRARELLFETAYWDENVNVALLKYKIPDKFPQEIQENAKEILENPLEFGLRKDLRHLRLYTIDDPETSELDDALSIETLPNSMHRVGVHIASPASIIAFNSPTEIEARRRASTIYLPQKKIPMLPKCIGEDLASLCEGQERPALSFLFTFDREDNLLAEEIVPSIVKVNSRLSYDEVEGFLEFGSGILSDQLRKIHEISEGLLQTRQSRGAIEIDTIECKFSIDPDTKYIKLTILDNKMMSRELISEFMILANSAAARFCAQNQLKVLYRSQERPHNFPSQKELDALNNEILKSIAMRKSLMPAVVSHSPEFHAGLGLDAYTQVTSPLRRYSDLFTQYQIESQILHNTSITSDEDASSILSASEEAIVALKAATRESLQLTTLKYLKQEEDKTISATIIAYATENSNIAHVILNECQMRASVTTRKRYPLGTTITLQIEQVKPEENYLLLRVVE